MTELENLAYQAIDNYIIRVKNYHFGNQNDCIETPSNYEILLALNSVLEAYKCV